MRSSRNELLPTLRPPAGAVLSAEQPHSSSLCSPAAGARVDAAASPTRATAATPGKRCTLWLLQLLCSAGLTPPVPTTPLCPTPPRPDTPLGVGEHCPVTPNDVPSPDHKSPLHFPSRYYFGVKVALYFAWLGWYTCLLGIAAVAGLVVFLSGMTVFSSSQVR